MKYVRSEGKQGARKKHTSIAFMMLFCCFKKYTKGRVCFKIPKFERMYFMDGPLIERSTSNAKKVKLS